MDLTNLHALRNAQKALWQRIDSHQLAFRLPSTRHSYLTDGLGSPQRLIKLISTALIAALAISYAGDYLWFRVRMIHATATDPVESFKTLRVLAIPEKGGKTSYEIDQLNPEHTITCTHTLFPHMGSSPCWYVKPRLNQPIPM